MTDNTKETAVTPMKDDVAESAVAAPAEGPDGRIERIVSETRQLSDELSEWVNLRVRLVQLDIQERIDEELDVVFSGVIVIAMFVVALLLTSFALAFYLGEVLGSLAYGFAIMAAFFVIVAAIVTRVRPKLASGFRSASGKGQDNRDGNLTKPE